MAQLKGIDISNWQGRNNLDLMKLNIDFCIVKATEGTNFVDPYCNHYINQCKSKKIKWGFYHFASSNNDPEQQAEFFYKSISNYIGYGIPVLDYEIYHSNDREFCERFVKRFYKLSKVYPLIYTMASWLYKFENSWIPSKCGLWLAGYPYAATSWIDSDIPYKISPWDSIVIWQFTSSLMLNGYSGNLDGNIAYISKSQWNAYAKGKIKSQSKPSLQPVLSQDELILQILNGKWGNNDDRINALTKAGYDADYIQQLINEYYDIAQKVINGKYGNGSKRKSNLKKAGYNYKIVQTIVNKLLDNI